MKGTVDESGRALVTLSIRANAGVQSTKIQAWIDTAFNGELVMPRALIDAAQLEQSAGIAARLADGNDVTGPYEAALQGHKLHDPNQPLEILRTIHSFDPCMGCAVHLVDPDGKELLEVKVL